MLSVNGILLHVNKANEGKVVSQIQMSVTTNVDEVDPKKCCRICLLKQERIDLFCLFGSNTMFEQLSIAAAIQDCFGIELKQDEHLPSYVCIKCASSTLQSYTFKKCLNKCQSYLEKQHGAVLIKSSKILDSENKENYLQETGGITKSESLKQKRLQIVKTADNNSNTQKCNKNDENIDHIFVELADHSYSKKLTETVNKIEDFKKDDFNNKVKTDDKNDFQETGKKSEGKKIITSIHMLSASVEHDQSEDKRETKIEVDRKIPKKENIKIKNFSRKLPNTSKRHKILQENKNGSSDVKTSTETDRWWSKEAGPPYECKVCGCSYGIKYRAFYMHVWMHRIKKLPCIYCGKRFVRNKMKIHLRTHTNERPYVCNQCSARFTVDSNLKRHLRCHTGEKLFICDICGKAFTTSTTLHNHKQAHTGETLYVCEYCGKTFSSDSSYRSHSCFHHNENKLADLSNDNSNSEQQEGVQKFTCGICRRVFTKAFALRLHERTHLDRKKFYCNLCVKQFDSRTNYRMHTVWHELQMEDSAETQRKEWACEFCLEIFNEKSAIISHIVSHMERPFICNKCGKTYTTKVALHQHSRQHSDERPFSCSVCSKTFKYSATLKQHWRLHTGEKPHKCVVCARGFTQHQQLLSHTLTHTGEKNHICPYCGKAFALNGNLTVHKRRHTGETPYICDVCGKGFYDSSSLKKHIQGHNKNFVKSEDR